MVEPKMVAGLLRMIDMIRLRVANEEETDVIGTEIADEFGLWDMRSCFPSWLARIIEGEALDFRNGEGYWYKE